MNKLSIRRFLGTYIFVCITLVGIIILFLKVNVVNKQGMVITTFFITGMIIFSELYKSSKMGYSLKDMLFIFMFIFMLISPLIQYVENSFPWWDTYLLTDEKIIHANLIIITFLLVYISIYKISFDFNNEEYKHKNKKISNIKSTMNIFFICTVFCSICIIINTGFSNLFARATNSLQVESSSLALIISNTFRSVPVVYVAMNLLFKIKNKYIYKKVLFTIGSVLMIIVNFPTATARFWTASIYLGLFIICIRKIKKSHFFKIIIFVGILIIFPIINAFRSDTFKEVISLGIHMPELLNEFLSGDFDSYSMLVRSIVYVDHHGITWGYQLLGNVLFFVPRKIWAAKPIGSGAMIATELGWSFNNISCPFIGEGYINFGILGIILFAIILSLVSKFADESYARVIESESKYINFIEIFYPFSLGFLFFILRGDLMSSLSYYIGFMLPVIALYLMQPKHISINKLLKEA